MTAVLFFVALIVVGGIGLVLQRSGVDYYLRILFWIVVAAALVVAFNLSQ